MADMESEHHFFAYLYRLRYIQRWSLMRSTVYENVAEHSYHVSLLTHVLCTIGNEVFGKQLPTDRAVSLALFHDVTEVITGDIPTPVKHHNPHILRNFREIEQLAADKLVTMIPDELRSTYEPLICGHADPELSRIVKAADLLDAYLKCTAELSAGNREFGTAKKQIERSISELDMPEVNYFLTRLAPSLEKTLDELSE
ncbi:5'-deoxynucleotidase [Paenibacillus sp. FJAT-26967]|uniref:5'-deoxynucleotidase n=1 Tax=Paenibacillus sp. FJAT-26967 TaxID=1729690 RepID=UPI000B2752C6|nr:5'-deoxynucleotidase [Paenibacillus sp. FJAT-26967]